MNNKNVRAAAIDTYRCRKRSTNRCPSIGGNQCCFQSMQSLSNTAHMVVFDAKRARAQSIQFKYFKQMHFVRTFIRSAWKKKTKKKKNYYLWWWASFIYMWNEWNGSLGLNRNHSDHDDTDSSHDGRHNRAPHAAHTHSRHSRARLGHSRHSVHVHVHSRHSRHSHARNVRSQSRRCRASPSSSRPALRPAQTLALLRQRLAPRSLPDSWPGTGPALRWHTAKAKRRLELILILLLPILLLLLLLLTRYFMLRATATAADWAAGTNWFVVCLPQAQRFYSCATVCNYAKNKKEEAKLIEKNNNNNNNKKLKQQRLLQLPHWMHDGPQLQRSPDTVNTRHTDNPAPREPDPDPCPLNLIFLSQNAHFFFY